jgi:glycosyltransferase involved in cell wall biosynthesis
LVGAFLPINAWISLALLIAYPLLGFRVFRGRIKRGDSSADARLYAIFNVISKFPMAIGQAKYYTSRIFGHTRTLIEYKNAASTVRVGYLTDQYPHVSKSFIRKEIEEVESKGIPVFRVSIRRPLLELLDDSDRKETARTKLLLETGLIGLGSAFAWTAVTRPVKCLLGAGLAFRLGARSGNRLRALSYLAQACLLRRWLAREGVSHLHTQIGTNTADVAMLCRKLGGPPFSFTVHGPAEFDRADALSIHDKIKSAAFVVAVSSFCRSQLFRHCTLADWSKIHVVRCAVDATFLDSATVPKTVALRMICIGRLAQQKGQLVLIEAVAGLRKAGVNFELVLVGDGPLRPQIEAAIAKCGVSSQVRITGWQNRDAVRNELVAATVLVMPSFAEGLPVELMEAMALGRPVVATYVAGIPELVQDGVNGWLVPAGDPAALTHVLTQALATGHDKLSEMGLAGISTLRTFHNASTEASKLVSLFSASAGRQSSVGGAS